MVEWRVKDDMAVYTCLVFLMYCYHYIRLYVTFKVVQSWEYILQFQRVYVFLEGLGGERGRGGDRGRGGGGVFLSWGPFAQMNDLAFIFRVS